MKDVNTSWQRFKIGLSIFVVGAVCLLLLSQYHIVIYLFSLATLFIGFAFAMYGYVGIFLSRFSSFTSKKPPDDI